MVVVMALRVEGEPWAQMRRSLPVWGILVSQKAAPRGIYGGD